MKINRDIHYYDSTDRKLKKNISSKVAILFSALVFSVIIISSLASPEFKRMKLIKLEKEMIDNNLELKRDMIGRIAKFNKTNKDLDEDDLKKIYNLLPDNSSLNKQMAGINKFATSGGNEILIKNFSTSKAKTPALNKSQNSEGIPDLKEVYFNLSLSGSFREFASFFDSIEKNIPLINVESLNIMREETEDEKNKGGGGNTLDCKVMFSLYHL